MADGATTEGIFTKCCWCDVKFLKERQGLGELRHIPTINIDEKYPKAPLQASALGVGGELFYLSPSVQTSQTSSSPGVNS